MSQSETPTPIEHTVRNRNDDTWFEYDGEPLFDGDDRDRLERRFEQMGNHDWEKICFVGGSMTGSDRFDKQTKIRTKDTESFLSDLTDAYNQFIEDYGSPLTRFGNAAYCDEFGPYNAVGVSEEGPRKSVVTVDYQAGHKAMMGGKEKKKQDIIMKVRSFEQWLVHTEVIQPLLDEYNEKYPY